MIFSHFKWDHKADDCILIEYQKMSLIEEITIENLDPKLWDLYSLEIKEKEINKQSIFYDY